MHYGRAEVAATAIMALYTGNANAGGGSNLADDGLSSGMTYGAPAVSPPAGVTPSAPDTPLGVPLVIANPFDNTIMVKGTGQDIDQIRELIKSLDVAPRGAH
jgi:type II secretory pathway component GspD/PulD (secretin)